MKKIVVSIVVFISLIKLFFHVALSETSTLEEPSYMLSNLDFDSDFYTPDMPIKLTMEINNSSQLDHSLWVGFSLISPTGKVIDFPLSEVTSHPNQSSPLEFSHTYYLSNGTAFETGPYRGVVSLWDSKDLEETSTRLDSIEVPQAVKLYTNIEHFQKIDDSIWFSRDGILGRTDLLNKHVFVDEDYLIINMPAHTLEGGELQTIDLMHYGSYEISMKLPDAPSSITGFFLYKAPDFHHEIDIEVFNEPDSKVLFTGYSNGSVQHENEAHLIFDPTIEFNQYRIDYFPDQVSFYINDELMQVWDDKFTDEPMHLMVNTWYPSWLEGVAPEEDQSLKIDWIKY